MMGKPFRIPAQYGEVGDWFDEWLLGILPTSRARTSNRKWHCFVRWSGGFKRVMIEIELAKAERGS